MAEGRYRIGTVARLSGLSTHVIRVWERRYAVLSPDRSAGGARVYGEADVERLRILKRGVDAGHSIGSLANLPTPELERLAASGGAVQASAEAAEFFVDELVRAVKNFDEPRAERAFASAGRTLAPRSLVIDVLAPMLDRIGEEWAQGKLCTASEHLGSALVRHRLGSLLREHQPPAGEPIVAATPAGELHEFGALLAAAVTALHGRRVLYLGPNLPAIEIAKAARGSGARLLLISVVALDRRSATREVKALLRELPEGVELLLGGARSKEVAEAFDPPLEAIQSLTELDDWFTRPRAHHD